MSDHYAETLNRLYLELANVVSPETQSSRELKLIRLLKRYAWHDSGCPVYTGCTCGFQEAMAALGWDVPTTAPIVPPIKVDWESGTADG